MRALPALALLCLAMPSSAVASTTLAPATKALPAKAKVAAPGFDPQLAAVLARLGEPVTLTKTERTHHRRVLAALAKNDLKTARLSWEALATSYVRRQDAVDDVGALIQSVIWEAYLDNVPGLDQHAEKLKHSNGQRRTVREHLGATRDAVAGKDGTTKVSLKRMTIVDGAVKISNDAELLTVVQWRAQTAVWERQLKTFEDLANQMQAELQEAIQENQRQLLLMSNALKMLHDTMKSIIDNLR